MSIPRPFQLLLGAVLLTSCGTVEDNSWASGISRADAYAIRDLVHAAHPNCRIYSYALDTNRPGHIYCSTSCETYEVRRTRRGWEIVGEAVVVV